jgi:DNA-binding transcriptional LysR family regulator
LIEAVQKSGSSTSLEYVTANTTELSLALLRGKLDLAIVDLPVRGHGLTVFPIYHEPLVVALPHKHPLGPRPIVRTFELRNQRISLLSPRTDPGSVAIESILQQKTIGSLVTPAANVIDLLDVVATNRSVGLMRSSAGRLRRDGVIYKPLADSIQLEAGISGRKGDHNPRMLSFRDTLIFFAQRQAKTSITA